MRRFTFGSALLLLAGIPVAAVVRAQESEPQSPTWSQRWGELKKSLTGDENDRGPAEVKGQDWSAGRKFGSSQRSSAPAPNKLEERASTQATPVQQPRLRTAMQQPVSPNVGMSSAQPVQSNLSSRRTASTGMAAPNSPITRNSGNALRPQNEPTPATMPESVAEKFSTAPRSAPSTSGAPAASPPTKGLSLAERIAARQAAENKQSTSDIESPTANATQIPFADRPQTPATQRTPIAPPAAPERSSPAYVAKSERPTSTPATSVAKPSANAANAVASDKDLLFARKSPQLAVETSGPRSIVIGKEASYTVTIQNSGEVAAQDVVVSVKVPAWADVVNARMTAGNTKPLSQAQAASEPFQWNIARLEGKSRQELVLQLVPRESKPFDLAVQWTFSPIASQTLVEVQEPKLAMTMSGPNEVLYGETKNYSIAITNPGTGAAENVAIELMPLGDGQAGARQVVGTIAAGESKVITVELTARQTGNVMIRAKATADNGLVADATEEVLVRRAEVELAVEGPKFTYAGTMINYAIQVANPGNATAEAVEVTAMLPSGAKFVSCSGGGQPSSDQSSVKWTLGGVRSGGDIPLEIKCVLNSAGPNRLEANAKSGDLNDKTSLVTSVEALADLKLEVSDPKGPVPVGEDMMYELHIINRGSRSAENIEVLAFFSEGIEPVAVQGGQHEILPGQVIFRPIHTLAADSDIVYKIKARANGSGNHVFRAEVNCQPLGTRLASEETTYFFGDNIAQVPAAVGSDDVGPTPAGVEPAQLQEPLTPIEAEE